MLRPRSYIHNEDLDTIGRLEDGVDGELDLVAAIRAYWQVCLAFIPS